MLHYWGNMVEGVFWIAIAGAIYLRSRGMEDRQRRNAGLAAFTFFWFGISDFLEAGTGAWYEPIWLLLMKVGCVVVFVYCLAIYLRLKKTCEKMDSMNAEHAEPGVRTSCVNDETGDSTSGRGA